MTALEFWFDFGSPNAYLSYKILPPILERTGASLEIIPCLLGGIFKATGNQPPMMAYKDVKGKLNYERLEFARFLKKHQLTKFKGVAGHTFYPHLKESEYRFNHRRDSLDLEV